MRALFDVNMLVALLDEQHVHHARAQEWWAAAQAHGWASCPLTQNGFLRVITQPAYPNPLSMRSAHDFLKTQIDSTNHEPWPADVSLLDQTRFDWEHVLGPKQLTDIYLLALAVKNGGRLVTLDDGVPSVAVRGAESRHLAVV